MTDIHIDTDISKLDDDDLLMLMHRYADVMSDTRLLVDYCAAKGRDHSITEIYAACKLAILELGVERRRRGIKEG